MSEICLKNKCGSCKHFKKLENSRCGECLKHPYSDDVVHDPKHPYWIIPRSRLRCRFYIEKGGEGVMSELKPCPFCGSSSVGLVDKKDPQGRPTYTIICVHCGASINNYSTPQYAKKKWNTRTPKERGGEK